MLLRASYPTETKRGTLVHELAHRLAADVPSRATSWVDLSLRPDWHSADLRTPHCSSRPRGGRKRGGRRNRQRLRESVASNQEATERDEGQAAEQRRMTSHRRTHATRSRHIGI
jgi:hypothetical protein